MGYLQYKNPLEGLLDQKGDRTLEPSTASRSNIYLLNFHTVAAVLRLRLSLGKQTGTPCILSAADRVQGESQTSVSHSSAGDICV